MIPNSTDTVQVTSNIDAAATGQFTFDEAATGKLMGVLTNLYSDPEGAAVREYLSNALDAQIQAQEDDPSYVWRPIEVTTPSHFQKSYIIRDFGIGMSVDDITNIYSKYGKSTKEHSNDVTGMLGLGSKCALTYTGQFTVTGYKNGVRTRAVISKDENDIPLFMIVDTRATTEPNGVEVNIPVRDRNSFAEKTRNFLKFWKDGQVLVDGVEPKKHDYKHVQDSPIKYTVAGNEIVGTANIFLIDRNSGYSYGTPQSYIVMGNVPYAVDGEYVDEHLRNANMGFVAFVPMGSVDFPPNRERLMYNVRTKSTVAQVSKGLFESILQAKLDEITNAPDYKTAWMNHNALDYHFGRHPKAQNLKYKGEPFIERLNHSHMTLDWDWQGHGQVSERQWINVAGAIRGSLVVTGVPAGTKPTSYFKKKVKHYIDLNDLDMDDALLVNDDIDSVWFDHLPRIDAETIKALKLPKTGANAGPRTEAPFEYYTVDAGGKTTFNSDVQIPVPTGKTLAYISPQDMKETYRKSGCSATDLAARLGEDYILVVTGKNRFEKFLRNHPGAITAGKAVQDKIDAYVAATTDAEYTVGKLNYGESEFLKSVKIADVKDPDLVALAQIVQSKTVTANYAKAEALYKFSSRASISARLPEKKNVKNNVAKRYPLIEHMGARQIRHLTIYVNAVYQQEHSPKKP